MGMSKKPRSKCHVPRAANIPMMRETRRTLALAMFAAIETLIERPSPEAYNHVSTRLMMIGRACGKVDCIESAKQALLDVYARYERVGKIGVDKGEAQMLRTAGGNMDGLLAAIPVNVWNQAAIRTVMQCRNVGA